MSYCKSNGLKANLRRAKEVQSKGNNVQRGLNVHKGRADVRKERDRERERAGEKADSEESTQRQIFIQGQRCTVEQDRRCVAAYIAER